MSVDFEAIAQRGHCDVSSLRLALPLLEQGYTPPFLARYRRDELGGLDEASLWALAGAVESERQIAQRRSELQEVWEQTPLRDPSLGHAIKKSNSMRMLARLGRRLVREESGDNIIDATRLAVRVLNPQKGDGSDFAAIAEKIEGISDAGAAVAGLNQAMAKRLAGDPRVVGAAVRWLAKHARINIAQISDPHLPGEENAGESKKKTKQAKSKKQAEPAAESKDAAVDTAPTAAPASKEETTTNETVAITESAVETPVVETPVVETPVVETPVVETPVVETPAVETPKTETAPVEASGVETPVAETPAVETVAEETAAAAPETSDTAPSEAQESTPEVTTAETATADKPAAETAPAASEKAKPEPKASKKQKKVSPRQRRRRWLVGVLKPLQGKKVHSDKLSSFQIVMLSRALRSQVAQCSFEYDATKLVAELQRAAAGINRHVEQQLRDMVLEHEASIREAAEAAWWEDLQERASARLVNITADHLSKLVNRGGVEAKVVMSIDAIGPRTAAATIVSSDGRVIHCEDIPCQLSAASRSQAVAKMGELIHAHHVDLVVVSNGPARRASMIAMGDLIGQSPEKSVRWTVADRSGADAYASSSVADQEMRSTPRRFRAAAWLAFSVLQPAQALAKVDPLKLRLSSFQRELADEAMLPSLTNVMVSGASRGGVDVNSAPATWLARLPGMNQDVADAIDQARRKSLFTSRAEVGEVEKWESSAQSRQAIPFLRVFGSEEALDGTLIHPEDYALARKLAATLEIELPPNTPPGYEAPNFAAEPSVPAQLSESQTEPQKPVVEEFTTAGESAPEFAVEGEQADVEAAAGQETAPADTEATSTDSEASSEAASDETEAPTPEAAGAEQSELAPSESDASESTEESPTAESQPAEEPTASDSTSSDEAASETPAADTPVTVHEPIKRPKPERAKIDKCIKEWQIGTKRAHQLVSWLCDPFGDSDISGQSPAVLTTMPTINGLKEGDVVIGVVVGVMPFGVFVELAPDCSGLIHVSRISESFVEDLHEAVQVGDVVTAWVTGIDNKRRRVALSAVSPEREAQLADAKRNRQDSRSGPRGQRGAQGNQRGTRTGTGAGAGAKGNRGGGKPAGKSQSGKPQGRGRDQGRQRRDNRGGKGRERKLESYRVVSKEEAKPITEEMQQGKEPLRSFGDLMQFFGTDSEKSKQDPPKQKSEKKSDPKKAEPSEQAEPAPTEQATPEPTAPEASEQTPKQPEAVSVNTPEADNKPVSEVADSDGE